MGCNCGRSSVSTGRKIKRKIFRCNKCNFDISEEYRKQEANAKLLLAGHGSIKIHVVCSKCKSPTVISTNL